MDYIYYFEKIKIKHKYIFGNFIEIREKINFTLPL